MRVRGSSLAALAFLALLIAPPVAAAPTLLNRLPKSQFDESSRTVSVVPVVVFGRDARRLPQAFAAEHGIDAAELTRNHTASGLIRCGNAHGAGQLTLTDDVVTTAGHVFYDENGMLRAKSCTFIVSVNGRDMQVPVDLESVVAGSTNPYNVAPSDDWAVARLVRPMTGVRPYGLAADVHENEAVTFVARGHIDWGDAKKLSMQECTLHNQTASSAQSGTREFSFDCDTGDGASGGALMFDRSYSRIGAILVGWRSNRPFNAVPFSRTHYNFAVTLEGAFRRAIYAAAGRVIVQK